jgi:hypothetical protein
VERAKLSFVAISSAVSRYSRRGRSITSIHGSLVRLATEVGREERFCSPSAHSDLKRASHLRAVRSLTPKARRHFGDRPSFLHDAPHHLHSTKRRHPAF